MQFERPITSNITLGDQPTEDDLARLKREGYVGVVNLRNPGEPEQPLGPAEEGEKVLELGMEYLHYGVGGAPLSESGVESVCDFVDRLVGGSGKVLVHCRKGGRAMALALIQQARANGWKPEETVVLGQSMGLEVDGGLRMLVEVYLQGRC
ncbi:MAG: protein tyrosine phosphatase family protein [Isosphaeraceae bacterium]